MSEEVIMRVARAISEADVSSEGDYRKLARAAIEAMRMPTGEMIGDGMGLTFWQSMIDAALK